MKLDNVDVSLDYLSNDLKIHVGPAEATLTDAEADLLITRLTQGLATKQAHNRVRDRLNTEADSLGMDGYRWPVSA